MLESVPWIGCLVFGAASAILACREWKRHRRRHPRLRIPVVSIEEFDPRFDLDGFEKCRDATVHFVSNRRNAILATPDDLETYVLAVLARRARRLFEFGTCTGRTAYLWALNSPDDAVVTTLTLPPETPNMQFAAGMSQADVELALSELARGTFLYSGTPAEAKVRQLFQDSATLDTGPFRRRMDLIFIDGGHSYPYVKSDSEKALEMIAPGGIILWHDYRGNRVKETRGVFRYLNELSRTRPLRVLQGTSLVVYREPAGEGRVRTMS